jgi:hypothetical protein
MSILIKHKSFNLYEVNNKIKNNLKYGKIDFLNKNLLNL